METISQRIENFNLQYKVHNINPVSRFITKNFKQSIIVNKTILEVVIIWLLNL